jgi:hypothetical protein
MPYVSAIFLSRKKQFLGWITWHLLDFLFSPGYFSSIPIPLVLNGHLLPRKSLQNKKQPSFTFKNTSSVIKIAVKSPPQTWKISNLYNLPHGEFLLLQPFAPLPMQNKTASPSSPNDLAAKPLPKGEKLCSTRQFNHEDVPSIMILFIIHGPHQKQLAIQLSNAAARIALTHFIWIDHLLGLTLLYARLERTVITW